MKHISLRITAMVAMIAMLAFAAISPAMAQTPAASGLEDIEGEGDLYGRFFLADEEALLGALSSPEADLSEAPPIGGITMVFDLDNDETAEEVFPLWNQAMLDELSPDMDSEFEETEIDDIGDEASLFAGSADQSGLEMFITAVSVRDGNVVYFSLVMTLATPSEDIATDITEFMMDGEPGDVEEVEFNADGTSTGGMFDVLPTDGDDVLHGMMADEDMFEQSEANTP